MHFMLYSCFCTKESRKHLNSISQLFEHSTFISVYMCLFVIRFDMDWTKKKNWRRYLTFSYQREGSEEFSCNSSSSSWSQVSPLGRIEPIIVNIIVQMIQMRQCVTPRKRSMLLNYSLISVTRI